MGRATVAPDCGRRVERVAQHGGKPDLRVAVALFLNSANNVTPKVLRLAGYLQVDMLTVRYKSVNLSRPEGGGDVILEFGPERRSHVVGHHTPFQ